jgi:FMN phosphatase YigB (HAD superfamily)
MGIIFDVGQVLCTVDLNIFTEKFNEIVSPRVEYKFDGMDFLSTIQCAQDIKKTTLSDSLYDLLVLGNIISENEMLILSDAWAKTVVPNKYMIEFKNWLIDHGYEVAILSNMGTEHRNYILKTYPQVFSKCITFFSCDVGYRKPSKIYFYKFLEKYPDFRGSVYIDDMIDNLNAGGSLGLRTYRFDLTALSFEKYELTEAIIDLHIKNILNMLET